jgi:energy-converting hydrogenase Eha subunit B
MDALLSAGRSEVHFEGGLLSSNMTMMSNYNKRQCGQPGQTGVLALLAVLLMTLFVLNSVPGVEARQVCQKAAQLIRMTNSPLASLKPSYSLACYLG